MILVQINVMNNFIIHVMRCKCLGIIVRISSIAAKNLFSPNKDI